MNIWLDDLRDPAEFRPGEDWVWVQTAHHCIDLLRYGGCDTLSLDHDLGDDDGLGTGYDVAKWLEEQAFTGNLDVIPESIKVHSANAVGRKRIDAAIASTHRFIERG